MAAPIFRGAHYDLHYHVGGAVDGPQSERSAAAVIAEFRRTLTPKWDLGLLAYLPEEDDILALLRGLCESAVRGRGMMATLGFGPRYLHSTGQLHKGGPPGGRFIQLVADFEADLPVPERDYTFGELHRAQADGDFSVLARGGRPVMRVGLKGDRLRALAAFVDEFTGAG